MSSIFPNDLDNFVSPNPNDKLNNVSIPHSTQHRQVNEAIYNIESKVGVTNSVINSTIDFGLKLLFGTAAEHPRGLYREISPSTNPFPTNVIWYTDTLKTTKLVEKQYVYGIADKKFVTQIISIIYDGTTSNLAIRTITDNITRVGPFEISRSRTIT